MNGKKAHQPFDLNTARQGRRILCGAALLLLCGGIWGAATSGKRTDSQMREDLMQQALRIAAAIPVDLAAKLDFTEADTIKPEFQRIAGHLKTFARAQNIRSLYTLALRDGQLVFGPESLEPGDPYASPPGTVYEESSPLDFELFETRRPVIQGPFSDEYGTFVSATAPVLDPKTGDVILTIGCDVEASDWARQIRTSQWIVFLLAEIPLMILLAGRALVQHRHRTSPQQSLRLRHTEAVTCAIAMLLLTLGAAAVLHRTDQDSRRRIFNSVSQLKAESFATQFNSLEASLHGLASFFESSESVSWKEFDTYCRIIIQKHPVLGCRWAPAVAPGTAREFENEIQRTTEFRNFEMWSRGPDGQPAPSSARHTAYPALYVSPLADHEHFMGFDLASDPVRFETIQRALQSGLASASAPSRPVSDPDAAPGILLCEPARSGNRQGLVSLFFQPETLIERTAHSPAEGPDALHTDILYFRNGSAPVPLTRHTTCFSHELKLTVPLFLFDQTYSATISPSEEWLAAHPLTYGKITLGIGLLLTVLGTTLVSVLANQPRLLRELVRKRTRELRSSEQYNRAIFDSTNDAVLLHDAESLAIVDANRAAEAMFGMSREELLQATLEQISSGEPPCTRAEAVRRMAAAQAGRPQIFDWRSRSADGSLFWTEISLHAAQAGTRHFIIAAVRNIEARRRVEEAIRKSEQRFEIAAQAGGIGIWDLDFQTGFLSWDERMHAICGTRPDELGCAYATWKQSLHPADLERVLAEVNAARDGRAEYKTQFRIVRPDGETRHIAASAEVIRAKDGTPLRMIGTNQDITEAKRAEAQLRLTQFAVDNLSDAAYWIDESGRFIYVNKASCRALGYTADELLGMSLWDIDPDETQSAWPTTLETIKTQTGISIERRHRRRDNRCFPVEVKISYIEFGDTRVICCFAHDITARSETHRRLEESRHFLRTVIDTMPGRVWWKDRDSVFLGCNLNFAKDAGMNSPSQLIGQTDHDMCWKGQADQFIADDQEVIETGQPKLGIQEFQTRTDGQPRWLETNKVPLRDADGNIVGTVGTYADITERKQAEARIADLARFPQENINPVLRIALDGTLLYSNAAGGILLPTLGAQVNQPVNGSWTHRIQQAMQTGRPIETEIRGDSKIFMATLVPVMERHYVNVYARDITDRKQAEAELRRLSTAIEQSPESVIITDPDGIICYVNPAFEAATGYRAKEVIGHVSSFLAGEQETQEFYKTLGDTLRQGNVWSGRLRSKRKSGAVRTDESVISPVTDPGGGITHYVAIQRDITDELAREAQLLQAQKMEAVGQLAGGIAHDFNNILQAILGFSELLLLTLGEDSAVARGNVLEIRKAGLHAADLTRQLLAFSRKQPAEFGPLDLNSVLQDADQILISIIGENVHLHSNRAPDLVPVNADRRQIERVLINLCVNARDAMPDGGDLTLSTGNVTFSAEDADSAPQAKAGTFACLSVSDTGTGMSPETRKHIFEPFFSTKAPGKGTGLGLSAIYGIVQEHQGWISVYSEPGRGSTFRIYLPALQAEAVAENDDRPARSAKAPGGTQRILVVEDDPSVRNLSKMALQKAGYRITMARNAEEAEELFAKENGEFDLLFSDVILPGKNGAELAAAIREIKRDLPVLLCSGYSGDRILNAGIDEKWFHFIEKPFSIVHLLKTVHQIFASR